MKALIVLSDNFEDVEAIGTRDYLLRSGIDVVTCCINSDKVVKTALGLNVFADKLIVDLDLNDYDMLIIPGGKYVGEIINDETFITNLISFFSNNSKYIAAICAAPRFLEKNGLLENKRFTCYPSVKETIKTGVYDEDAKAVTSGKIITSRSVATVLEFTIEIIKALTNDASIIAKLLDEIVI